MGEVEGALRDAATQIQPEIQSRLTGLFGGLIRGYLPQAWVIVTEQETVTLRVDKAGAVAVAPGADPTPDVTLTITKSALLTALKTRKKDSVPPGSYTVTPHTSKGKTAFDVMKGRLGL